MNRATNRDHISRVSSKLRLLTPANWHALVAIVISVAGLLHGSGLKPGTLIIFLLFVQVLLGTETATTLLQRRLSLLESTSLGSAFGMLWIVGLQQFVLWISGSSRIFWIPSIVIAILLRYNNRPLRYRGRSSDSDAKLIVPIAGIVLALQAPGFTWTTVVGVSLLMGYHIVKVIQEKPSYRRRLTSLYGLLVLVSSTLALTLFFIDDSWKAIKWQDTAFFDALGVFVARFGAVGASPVLAGQSVLDYHWLLYGYQGIITDFSRAAPFLVQTQISIFINSVMIVSSITVVSRLLGGSRLTSLTLSAVAVSISGFHSANLSEGFVVLAIQFVLLLGFNRRDTTSEISFTTGVTLLSIAALLAKGTSFLVALSVAGSAHLIRVRNSHSASSKWGTRGFDFLPTLICVGIIVGTFFSKYGPAVNRFDVAKPVSFARVLSTMGIIEGLWTLRGQTVALLCISLITLLIVNLLIGVVRDSHRAGMVSDSQRYQFFALTSVMVTTLCLAVVTRSVYSSATGFVLGSGLQTSVFLLLCTCVSMSTRVPRSSSLPSAWHLSSHLIPYVLLLSITSALIFRSDFWRSHVVQRLWGSRIGISSTGRWLAYGIVDQSLIGVSAAIYICVLAVAYLRTSARVKRATLGADWYCILVIPTFMAVLGFATTSTVTAVLKDAEARHESLTSKHPHMDRDINWPTRRSPDLVALGEVIRSSTQQDDLFASNNFCCFGESWLQQSELADSAIRQDDFGGANFQLPAETQRRFLLQGPRFLGEDLRRKRGLSASESKVLKLSLSFANSPTEKDVLELQKLGARYFVVNLGLTNLRDWSEFAIERFRSSEFLLLEFSTSTDT